MKKWKIAVLVMLIISLVTGYFLWQTWGSWQEEGRLRSQAEAQIELYKTKLDTTEADLAEKQGSLNRLETEFTNFKTEAASNFKELDSELSETKVQLNSAVDHVLLVSSELQGVRTEKENQKTYYEARLIEEFQGGQREGRQAALEETISLRDPTYEELKKFLAENQVNWRTWVPAKYVCVDFAADLNNDAEAAGFRSAYVWIVEGYDSNGYKWGHLMNGFQTTDRGFVFVEPQTDNVIPESELKIGGKYWGEPIREITIIW